MKKHLTFAFGRFSPPHLGHGVVVNHVINHAKKVGGDHMIVATQSHDNQKNPLSHEHKTHFLSKMFPHANVIKHKKLKNVFDVLDHAHKKGYEHVTMVTGSDRTEDFRQAIKPYLKNYKFKSVNFEVAGKERNSSSGVSGFSSSRQRKHAMSGDFNKFHKGVSTLNHSDAKKLYGLTRKGLGLKEETQMSYREFLRSFNKNIYDVAKKYDNVFDFIRDHQRIKRTPGVTGSRELAKIWHDSHSK